MKKLKPPGEEWFNNIFSLGNNIAIFILYLFVLLLSVGILEILKYFGVIP
jgi:hypothetical protein